MDLEDMLGVVFSRKAYKTGRKQEWEAEAQPGLVEGRLGCNLLESSYALRLAFCISVALGWGRGEHSMVAADFQEKRSL